MTPQDPTPSMGFWVFHDPMVKREKEMKVRKFLVMRKKKTKRYLEFRISMQKISKILKKKKKEALCYKTHFAELAITALKPASVPVDDPYKTPKSELCYTAVSICQGVF